MKDKNAFIRVTWEDPHVERRHEMLKKYPEIKQLLGPEPKTKYIALSLVFIQLILAYYVKSWAFVGWFVIVYCFGATINHSLFTVIHEITHHLGFKSKVANRLFGIFVNLPLGVPVAMGFEKYHYRHHRFLGDSTKDVDIPFYYEAKIFNSRPGKFLWLVIQPLTYTLRPFFKDPRRITSWELINIFIQILFDILVVWFFGYQFLVFLLLSTFVGMSIHPLASHSVAEHYVVNKHQETYSYYGLLNYLTFNVGYHVEHHDFPTVAWSKLPKLKKIAPEYYDTLYVHRSWIGFFIEFILSKKINLFSRVVR